ncbi:MAG: M14 family zinc carboxypeptidase [Pseudomonadota bacterium]
MRIASVLAAALAFFSSQANSEPIEYFQVEGVSYNRAITTPDAFIGYGLGEKPVRHDVMVGYLRSLAQQSDRITKETIGYSHEGRPILSFVITSPENQARINEIKAAHKARLNPANADTEGPAVVWLNYGVHGAESSGMDAAIPMLYHLAAAEGEPVEQMLEDTVIVIVAIFNPDGHSRRINHVYTFGGVAQVTDPQHALHNLWIEARTNHYWFDLNRDWLLLTQPESQAWIAKWHEWKPNVSGDFHEMGSNATYYFHPGEPKRKNPLIPDRERELLSSIAEEHAAWLDAEGELYTSEDGFDNFYVGKGSTYPSINGSVGILFEAAAARGGAIETDNGERTYAQNIRIHFNTSLTTVNGAMKNRQALRQYQRQFFTGAPSRARAHPVKGYVFTTNEDEARLSHFVELLERHDIAVHRLARDLEVDGRRYEADKSYIVDMAQPQFTMLRGIFDRVTTFEENIFYDVSGWTLPLAYDLDYAGLDNVRFNRSLLGDQATAPAIAKPAPEEATYGYIFEWNDYYAPRALHRLQKADILTRVLIEPKTLAVAGREKTFGRGSVFVPLLGQTTARARIHELAAEIAAKDGVDIAALSSGNATAGGGDLGSSNSASALQKPSVLLLFDGGVSRYAAGQLWHLMDKRMEIPVTLRQKSRLVSLDLTKYTHIVLPGGDTGPEGAMLNEDARDALSAWINTGGVFVAMKESSIWAQDALLADTLHIDDEDDEDAGDDDTEDAPERFDYADKNLKDAEHVIGGALFESDLDPTHPLAFGHNDRAIATMRAMTDTLETPLDPVATVARYTETPLLSGYASDKRIDEIAGTPMLTGNAVGDGAIVLFADDPSFRATFFGSDKLFLNALFFGALIEGATFDGGHHDHQH